MGTPRRGEDAAKRRPVVRSIAPLGDEAVRLEETIELGTLPSWLVLAAWGDALVKT